MTPPAPESALEPVPDEQTSTEARNSRFECAECAVRWLLPNQNRHAEWCSAREP